MDWDFISTYEKPSGLICPECGMPQYRTDDGLICDNYHKLTHKIANHKLQLIGKTFTPTEYKTKHKTNNGNIILRKDGGNWYIILSIYSFAMDGGHDNFYYWSHDRSWYEWENDERCGWKDCELEAAMEDAIEAANQKQTYNGHPVGKKKLSIPSPIQKG